jgi:hypothetical protein
MPLLFAFMLLFSSMAFVFSMGLMDSWWFNHNPNNPREIAKVTCGNNGQGSST